MLTASLSYTNTIRIFFCLLLVFGINNFAAAKDTKHNILRYEYAVFYMETEGEFIIPVSADAPEIYSWSDPSGSVKGDISQIWQYLKMTKDIEYSFTEIESSILNHVGSSGWQLQDLEVNSVPITSNHPTFRSAYRYIFKRMVKN